MIAAITFLPPYSLIVQPDIQKLEDLKGKTCVQSSLSSGETPFLKTVLLTRGLKYPDDYSLVVGGGVNERIAAMQANAAQCTMITPPQNFDLVDQGKKEIIKANDVIKSYHFFTMAVNTNWASKNRETVVKVLKGMIQGQTWAMDPKNREALAPILVKYKAAPEKYAQKSVDAYMTPGAGIMAPEMKFDMKALDGVVAQMKELGTFPKDATPDWSKYMDMSYWEEATGKKFQ
jgi:ABC-type nitrate/sulfonate/bicarbonate transport system substrate-binding protein